MYIFFGLVLMCMHAHNALVIHENDMDIDNNLITLGGLIILCVFVGTLIYNLNMFSRFAFNGGLFLIGEESEAANAPSSLSNEQDAIARTVRHLNPNDSEVVDDYLHGRRSGQGRKSMCGLNKRKKGMLVT